jgi:hypothetical protein
MMFLAMICSRILQQTDVSEIIMDFGKAFDKVNHSLLIHKLRYYEIDGKTTRWIQNWLEDRQQTVVIDGVSSEAVSVDVHQGSVQGPGLFLFYVNDLQSRHVVVDIKCCFLLHVA